jgi:AcrR family transcriptional regulator
MTSDTRKWAAPKERVSRQEAEESLIAAVIALVDTTPIADITIHQLAQEAGVNFGYINRYFESRLNLFAAATDALADLGIKELRKTVHLLYMNNQGRPENVSELELKATRNSMMPLGVKRLQIVQFLVLSGVPAERFVKKSQEVMEAGIEATTNAGLDPVLARARIIHGIAMMWSAATLGPVLGVSLDELQKSYEVFFADATNTSKDTK